MLTSCHYTINLASDYRRKQKPLGWNTSPLSYIPSYLSPQCLPEACGQDADHACSLEDISSFFPSAVLTDIMPQQKTPFAISFIPPFYSADPELGLFTLMGKLLFKKLPMCTISSPLATIYSSGHSNLAYITTSP